MMENLSLKNEFMESLTNYAIVIFQAGDLNKIRDLFMKYNLIETNKKQSKVVVNQAESIKMLLSFLDEETFQKD